MKDKMKGLYKEAGAEDKKKLRGAFKDDADVCKAFDECDDEVSKSLRVAPDALDAILKSLEGAAATPAAAAAPSIVEGTPFEDPGLAEADPNTPPVNPMIILENIQKSLDTIAAMGEFTRKAFIALGHRSNTERDLIAKSLGGQDTTNATAAGLVERVDAMQKSLDAISTRLSIPAAAPRGITTLPSQVLADRADAAGQSGAGDNAIAPDAGTRIEKSLQMATAIGNHGLATQLRPLLAYAQDGRVTEGMLKLLGVP